MGAGTTALVAKELGRNYVGIELNGDYIRLAEERVDRCVCAPKEDDLF
jgi:DNA modification methylase